MTGIKNVSNVQQQTFAAWKLHVMDFWCLQHKPFWKMFQYYHHFWCILVMFIFYPIRATINFACKMKLWVYFTVYLFYFNPFTSWIFMNELMSEECGFFVEITFIKWCKMMWIAGMMYLSYAYWSIEYIPSRIFKWSQFLFQVAGGKRNLGHNPQNLTFLILIETLTWIIYEVKWNLGPQFSILSLILNLF